jgi:hypothetical protein
MSIPRAATSVATRNCVSPFFTRRITSSRFAWLSSPEISSASRPCRARKVATVGRVLSRVAEDDRGARLLLIEDREQRAHLVEVGRRFVEDVIDPLDLVGVGREHDVSGSVMYRPIICLIASSTVALKSSIWRPLGVWSRILVTSSRKPIESISSASSRQRELDLREVEVPPPQVIEDPARGADDDVDAVLERLLLRAEADAAVDRRDAEVLVLRERRALLGDLDRELARRREDDRATVCLPAGASRRSIIGMQNCTRLAGAGLGADDQVLAAMAGSMAAACTGVANS